MKKLGFVCKICKFNAMYRSKENLLPQSLYRILCPLLAKRTNTLLTTFVVNVRRLVPSFSQPQHIDLERCAALSRTPALLEQLFIYRVASNAAISSELYRVASNAAISSELPHARSLTRGRIPELFEWHRPSANALKIFLACLYNYKIFFLWNIFNLNIFQFTVYCYFNM